MAPPPNTKPLGLVLREADLITLAQIEVALQDQQYFQLPLGEILALHGWIRQETADFFAEHWPHLRSGRLNHQIGYYFHQAGLLQESQIQTILQEQKHLGIRFGTVAVLKGWLKQKTLDYFLENLVPQSCSDSAFQVKATRPIATSPFRHLPVPPPPSPSPSRQALIMSESTITVPRGFQLSGLEGKSTDREDFDLADSLDGHIDVDEFFWTE